jgi:23S rRNA (guanosine2251-2'-O)-methyltransferase
VSRKRGGDAHGRPAGERASGAGGRRGRESSPPRRDRGTAPRGAHERHLGHDRDRDPADAGAREVLVGIHPVLEALRARTRAISRILLSSERRDARTGEIARLAREAGLPVQHLPPEAIARLVPRGLPHQGVAAEIAPHAYADAEALLERAGPRSLFVLLDEVQDPRNLGAIARTAAAVGADALFLPLHRSASVTPAADKASAGGLSSLPVARVHNLARLLESMREKGIVRIGLDGRANELYTAIPGDRPVALVMGGEEKGLRPIVRAACDQLVRIPIPGPVESLNVSVAAAIALYEVLRARSRGA